MTHTTYTIHDNERKYQIEDADRAEELSRDGYRVTAVTQ